MIYQLKQTIQKTTDLEIASLVFNHYWHHAAFDNNEVPLAKN